MPRRYGKVSFILSFIFEVKFIYYFSASQFANGKEESVGEPGLDSVEDDHLNGGSEEAGKDEAKGNKSSFLDYFVLVFVWDFC